MFTSFGSLALAQSLAEEGASPSPCCAMMSDTSKDTSFDYMAALAQSAIPKNAASFFVQAVNQPSPLVAINVKRPQNPGSVIKMITSFIALKTYGADYRWTTSFLSEGRPDANGVLHEPLYLKGSGDPQLVIEKIDELTQNLTKAGVKQIDAPILIDRSIFKDEKQDAASFDGEPDMPYNAQPDAALMNYRALNFQFEPSTKQVTLVPWLLGYALHNNVQWVDGPCPNGGWKSTLSLNVNDTGANIGGRYYSGCGVQSWHFHAHRMSANDYARGVLAGLMSSADGLSASIPSRGNILDSATSPTPARPVWTQPQVLDGKTPHNAQVLASVQSAPLAEELRDMNHFSNNVMARQIYLSFSVKEKQQGNLPESEAFVHRQLAAQGLTLKSLHMGNGSGLSRINQVSASDLGKMLIKSSSDEAFVNSLARLGIEGTVKNRLKDTDMVGRARLKTGTLNDVRAIAGYVDGKSGTRYVVVSIIQDINAQTPAGKRVHDVFLQWVGAQ
ncbi:D-alanyl-D-alanine carboxypeptidase/D-alanyl-D-alanine-endopeptidase [Hydromonas duriensis]|uniref:D-alanyl-D-alanine carboxypeptidase/D-alanyl-D-alanine-endopeptidase (Penicillin-binding protein 4) n=1 Tax=Hydromonas duriensis TaxID=1527608 RepID=A0A4R6Y8D9_9BURK|nr:D-alanyl-D-alanine carboxypeptidase [Hydromonas duriensis]TDR31653.1 D-alanyl-D-alanine carboxypeptidase/D-alanyl-D-alanine-endopeptidase (penicillin-binding protein 4) [Hydromonas duriensis]